MKEYKVIETIPKIERNSCKLILFGVTFLLYALPFLLALLGWLEYDFFIGFCLLCFGYLVNSIIHSKIRQFSVPTDQKEISFSSFELAKWFVGNYLFCK